MNGYDKISHLRTFDVETMETSLSRYAALPSDGLTRLNELTAPLELEYKFDFLFKRKRGQSAAMRLLCLD